MSVDTTPYLRQFAEAKPRLRAIDQPWLEARRDAAIARFRGSGFPTGRIEAWKFTDLGPLARAAFGSPAAAPASLSRASLERFRLTPDCHLVTFVNGQLRPELSVLDHLPDGTRVVGLAEASEDDLRALTAEPAVAADPRARALFDLNTAFMRDGAVIDLGRGAVIDPVQLLFVAMPQAEAVVFHPRTLIRAEPGSSATVLETYVGLADGSYWTNVVTQIVVAANAVLRHYKLQAEGRSAFHVAATSVRLGERAAYRAFAASLGAELGRDEYDVDLGAPDGEARLSGVTIARAAQHLDTTIRVDHARPRGASSQEFRSVVDDRAHSVFQGRIRVAPGAQKTDARQVNRNLLLSARASADTKPELEILADDVKCSHGATVGDLNTDALFYLRARGVGEPNARAMLIDAFVGELIDAIEGDAARAFFRRRFDALLAGETRR